MYTTKYIHAHSKSRLIVVRVNVLDCTKVIISFVPHRPCILAKYAVEGFPTLLPYGID